MASAKPFRVNPDSSFLIFCSRPFSLARMIKVTEGGRVIYRAGKSECVRFPQPGDERLREGVSRNFQFPGS